MSREEAIVDLDTIIMAQPDPAPPPTDGGDDSADNDSGTSGSGNDFYSPPPAWGSGEIQTFGSAYNSVMRTGDWSRGHYGSVTPGGNNSLNYTPHGSKKSYDIAPDVKSAMEQLQKEGGFSQDQAAGIAALIVRKGGFKQAGEIVDGHPYNIAGLPEQDYQQLLYDYQQANNVDLSVKSSDSALNKSLKLVIYDLQKGKGQIAGANIKAATTAAEAGEAAAVHYGIPLIRDAENLSDRKTLATVGNAQIFATPEQIAAMSKFAAHDQQVQNFTQGVLRHGNAFTGYCLGSIELAANESGLKFGKDQTSMGESLPSHNGSTWAKDVASLMKANGAVEIASGIGALPDELKNYLPDGAIISFDGTNTTSANGSHFGHVIAKIGTDANGDPILKCDGTARDWHYAGLSNKVSMESRGQWHVFFPFGGMTDGTATAELRQKFMGSPEDTKVAADPTEAQRLASLKRLDGDASSLSERFTKMRELQTTLASILGSQKLTGGTSDTVYFSYGEKGVGHNGKLITPWGQFEAASGKIGIVNGKMVNGIDNPDVADVKNVGPVPPGTYKVTLGSGTYYGDEYVRYEPIQTEITNRDGILGHRPLVHTVKDEDGNEVLQSHGCIVTKQSHEYIAGLREQLKKGPVYLVVGTEEQVQAEMKKRQETVRFSNEDFGSRISNDQLYANPAGLQSSIFMAIGMDQLRKEGVPEEHLRAAAALLLGEAEKESGQSRGRLIDPELSHDGGTGTGIYGARNERRAQMFGWLKANGYDLYSAEGQFRYMAHEAMNAPDYITTRDILLNASANTLGRDTPIVTSNFERPAVVNYRTDAVVSAYNSYSPIPAPDNAPQAANGVTTETPSAPADDKIAAGTPKKANLAELKNAMNAGNIKLPDEKAEASNGANGKSDSSQQVSNTSRQADRSVAASPS